MPFRITTFLLASLIGGAAGAFAGWHFAALGAWAGAVAWLALDAWRAQRLLNALRGDAAGLPARGSGLWGELAERIRKLLRERDKQTQQAQERLQEFLSAIQASPNGVVLLDEQGRIEWCNQTAAAQFGLDTERDLMQHLPNLVRDPAFVAYLASWNYSRDVVIDAPSRLPHRGAALRLSVQAHPYAGNRRMLLLRDVTALEQMEAMRRDFVANVSHEIRTPLTVLAGFVETLQTLPLDAGEREHYLGLMSQQSHRMETLVNDLLTLSRLEGSAPPPVNRWVGVRALMTQCENEARALSGRLAPQQGHRLSFTIEADGHQIAGAATELQSAMSNLVSNAVRYTPAGGEVAVSWRLLPDGSGEYAVRDTGPGIAGEHIPRLTERFYRIDRSRSRETGGTGLGLAIVKHVAQRHGAQLLIDSKVGEGSRFALVFPAVRLRV
jgi:two-component system phosphate regulon sensor histidine kinase PhoR